VNYFIPKRPIILLDTGRAYVYIGAALKKSPPLFQGCAPGRQAPRKPARGLFYGPKTKTQVESPPRLPVAPYVSAHMRPPFSKLNNVSIWKHEQMRLP
jgi:hypothetical protein